MSLTKEEVKSKIGNENWSAFLKFMRGQTGELSPSGELLFYEGDVENFLHKLKTGKALFFD